MSSQHDEPTIEVFVKAKRASNPDDYETWKADGPAPTLNAFDNGSESRATVLAFDSTFGGQSNVFEDHTLPVKVGSTAGIPSLPAVAAPDEEHGSLAVRRLTPRECERLMGWPDDWTRYDDEGNEVADSHRYRMCGNGVVANVAEAIGRLIVAEHDATTGQR